MADGEERRRVAVALTFLAAVAAMIGAQQLAVAVAPPLLVLPASAR